MFSVYTEYDDVALFHFHRLSFIGTASLRCHDFHFFRNRMSRTAGFTQSLFCTAM